MARLSRYSRSRAKSTRCSKSTFMRPGAGVSGRAGTGGMGATMSALLGACIGLGVTGRLYSMIKRMYSMAVKGVAWRAPGRPSSPDESSMTGAQ